MSNLSTFQGCFLPSFDSLGQAVSEEKIFFRNEPIRNNNWLWRPLARLAKKGQNIPAVMENYIEVAVLHWKQRHDVWHMHTIWKDGQFRQWVYTFRLDSFNFFQSTSDVDNIAIDIEEEVEVPEFDDVLVNNDMIFLEAEKLDDSIDDEQDDDCFDEDIHLTNRDIVSLQQKSYKLFLDLMQ